MSIDPPDEQPLKEYDPVTGDEEEEDGDDDDGDDDDGDEWDADACMNHRDLVRDLHDPEYCTGRRWVEIASTLEAVTYAMQVGVKGCLLRVVSWGVQADCVEYAGRDTTWLPGVLLADLLLEPS